MDEDMLKKVYRGERGVRAERLQEGKGIRLTLTSLRPLWEFGKVLGGLVAILRSVKGLTSPHRC